MTLLIDDIWGHASAKQLLDDVAFLKTALSKTNARAVFSRAGFGGEGLDIALGVSYAESAGYSDAVGDISLVTPIWGPSIGLFQVRSMRDPLSGSVADRYRFAWALRDPDFNARAAFVISKSGTDWSLWSTFTHGTYLARKGVNYTIRTGHENASKWSA